MPTVRLPTAERAIEEASSGSDEWPTGKILVVTRRLADEHQDGTAAALAEDGLRGTGPQRAAATARGGAAQRAQRPARREEVGGRAPLLGSSGPGGRRRNGAHAPAASSLALFVEVPALVARIHPVLVPVMLVEAPFAGRPVPAIVARAAHALAVANVSAALVAALAAPICVIPSSLVATRVVRHDAVSS